MKLQSLSCRGKLSQFVVTRLCKQKEPQSVNVVRMKEIMLVINSAYIFFNQIEIIFFHPVQLNLVKVLVMQALSDQRFHQVLFDMLKNEYVISQPVKVVKIIITNYVNT